jgi:EAL domain-containing protein (putative c-di-GMP-specific phosphodiesterase class I)
VAGLAQFPGDSSSPPGLLECAQKARLDLAPGQRIGVFRPDSNRLALRELQVEAALREALKRDELTLHFQPQASLESGRIVGAEALLRWESKTLGTVTPVEFIPVAERCGLIGEVGDWVLRHVCEQVARWQRAGMAPLRIGMNLSPAQLQQTDLAWRLQTLMAETGAEPARLGIELTESAAMADVAQATRLLGEIRALGVGISLDDFGTGYSSLGCLRSLPIDVVKIDRAFVHDVTDAPEDVAFTRALISMAHGLHKQVLAEGVETEGQLALLAADHADRIQGHLLARALPAAEFEALLRVDHRLPERFLLRRPRQRTLLLVDDEANILSSLKRLLRRDGYRILTASSGQEGLARLAEAEVDVIV